MRGVLKEGSLDGRLMALSLISNVIWMAAAALVYLWVLRRGRETGTLTRVTSH
jgi:hypothetical protein